MIDSDQIDKLFKSLNGFIPLSTASDEIKLNIKRALTSFLNEMDFVTRDEFDAQCRVLLKTRNKLEVLEKKIHAFETESPKEPF